jgi:hypothetical protein
MRVKIIEGNELKELIYRPWNGVQYGADTSEEITKTYSKTPYDRSAGAYIMSRKEYEFWDKYFSDLAEDEKAIREANLAYHPADVEDYLRKELDLAGDDPRLHHAARQQALESLAADFPLRARNLQQRERRHDMPINFRLSYRTDTDIIDFMRQAERLGEPRTTTFKRLVRVGIEYEKQIEREREDKIREMKKEGWL